MSLQVIKKNSLPAYNVNTLSDAEQFIKSMGDVAFKINPKLVDLESELKTRQLVSLGGKILGAITVGSDGYGISGIDFVAFKRAYKSILEKAK